MTTRITKNQTDTMAAQVTGLLEQHGTDAEVRVIRQNGHTSLYRAVRGESGPRSHLTAGTEREAHTYLSAMREALYLVSRS